MAEEQPIITNMVHGTWTPVGYYVEAKETSESEWVHVYLYTGLLRESPEFSRWNYFENERPVSIL